MVKLITSRCPRNGLRRRGNGFAVFDDVLEVLASRSSLGPAPGSDEALVSLVILVSTTKFVKLDHMMVSRPVGICHAYKSMAAEK